MNDLKPVKILVRYLFFYFIFTILLLGTFRNLRKLFSPPEIGNEKIIGYTHYYGYPFYFDNIFFFLLFIPILIIISVKLIRKVKNK